MRMTFGYELELGDVLRDREIPERFGAWEYAETDIVNLHEPYKYVAVDPLGKEPPMGGEINIAPGRSVEELSDRVNGLIEWFRQQGDSPTAACVNEGHVHVRVEGLRDDIRLLKRLTRWIAANQSYLLRVIHAYQEDPLMKLTRTARTYLKWDCGRPMPDWMAQNIERRAETFDDFIHLQCCGKDGQSVGRPFRYAVNTYCLKHIDTVEFRLFRASVKPEEIEGSIRLARDFMVAGLSDMESAEDIVNGGNCKWPPFFYHHNSYVGWENTKWPKERGKKVRRLIQCP